MSNADQELRRYKILDQCVHTMPAFSRDWDETKRLDLVWLALSNKHTYERITRGKKRLSYLIVLSSKVKPQTGH